MPAFAEAIAFENMDRTYIRCYSQDDALPVEAFEYQPLDPDNPSTRLVRLLKAKTVLSEVDVVRKIPRIRCQLDVTYVGSDRKTYDAVSYAWETPKMDRIIELSGRALKVSRTVEDVLLRLRDENEDRLLWIDQICINQKDNDEKAVQVGRMKDIFGGARRVIVSLGPHDKDVVDRQAEEWPSRDGVYHARLERTVLKEQAMEIIRPKWALNLAKRSLSKDHLSHLAALMASAWFDRVWVVQEIAFAKSVSVICGKQEIDGRDFERLYTRVLTRVKDEVLIARLDQVRPLLEYMWQDTSVAQDKPELLYLLQQFRCWKATVPHDKVYALLGLSVDGTSADLLKPDYSLTVAEVFKRVVQYMLIRYGSPAILTYASNSIITSAPAPDEVVLPSWCPDWREPHRSIQAPDFCFAVSPLGAGFPLSTERKDSVLGPPPSTSLPEISGDTLRVTGILLATVHAVLDHGIDVSIPLSIRGRVYNMAQTCSAWSEYLQEITMAMARFGGNLRKHDRIVLLESTSGIVILRPAAADASEICRLVLLTHSNFPQVRYFRNLRHWSLGGIKEFVGIDLSGELPHTTFWMH